MYNPENVSGLFGPTGNTYAKLKMQEIQGEPPMCVVYHSNFSAGKKFGIKIIPIEWKEKLYVITEQTITA